MDAEVLTAAFGEGALPRVEDLVEEMMGIAVDWEQHTLASGAQAAEAEMSRRHPDLSHEALKALGAYFSCSWK